MSNSAVNNVLKDAGFDLVDIVKQVDSMLNDEESSDSKLSQFSRETLTNLVGLLWRRQMMATGVWGGYSDGVDEASWEETPANVSVQETHMLHQRSI